MHAERYADLVKETRRVVGSMINDAWNNEPAGEDAELALDEFVASAVRERSEHRYV